MSTVTVTRKQIARLNPSANSRHRADPSELLGLDSRGIQSILDVISSGLRWSSASRFLHVSGLTQMELADYLGVTPRTLARRKKTGSLNQYESERIFRLAEIYDAALHLFDGQKTDAREWLLSPVRGLNDKRPIDYACSEFGAREVRNLIGRLEHGVFS
jgi:putative toxin-antitoxin system antitoxin component (TIGR02293 family)